VSDAQLDRPFEEMLSPLRMRREGELWIDGTGQRWKLSLFSFLIVLEGISLFVADNLIDWNGPSAAGIDFFVICTIATALTLAWFLWSVRCNECGAHVAARMGRRSHGHASLMAVGEMRRCPRCDELDRPPRLFHSVRS